MKSNSYLKGIRNFLVLARIELAGFSFVAVIGAMTVLQREISLVNVFWLFLFNILLVIFGFVHNDYEDYNIDRKLPELQNRPLVNGSITPKAALYISVYLVVITLVLAFIVYGQLLVAGMMALALLLAALYNRYSKTLLGADIFYALSAGCLFIFGALAAVEEASLDQLTPFTLLMAAVMTLEHLSFNIASGQLKDVKFDHLAGVKSLAVAMSTIRGDIIEINTGFKAICIGIKLLTYILVFSLFAFNILPTLIWQLLLLLLFTLGSLLLTIQLLGVPLENREKILELTRKQEMFSKSLIPIVLLPTIGLVWVFIITVGPVIWFTAFNFLLNRELLGNPKTF